MNTTPSRSQIALALFVSFAALTFPAPVSAQSSESELEEVVITGTRIARRDLVSPSPLVTTDMQAVFDSGRPSIDDYLKDLPQFAPGSGDFSNDSNGGTAGRATLNLRNLGAKRNLVIMDGRRLMSSGTDGAIDINTIPAIAISNIEVITGGASATYGSDALSGVVNFKTRTDLDGFDFDAQYQSLDDAGDDSYRFGLAYGTEYADGKGNLLLTAEHFDRGGVRYLERDFFNVNPQHSTFIVYGHSRRGGNIWSVDNAGNLFDAGDIDDASTGLFTESIDLPLLIRGDDLRTHGQYFNWIQVPLEQTNLFAKTDYDLGGGTTLYGQVLYATSTAFNEGAAPNSAGIWGVTIPADNFYLQQIPDLAALFPGGINNNQRRFAQAGGRVYETGNDVVQLLVGASGEFGVRDMTWDLHASFGETDTSDRTISGSVNFAAVQDIIDTTDPATGATPLCAGGFNPFGGTTPLSPECLAFVSRTPENNTTLTQSVVEGVVQGKLADLPAGEARFALTAGFRRNTYEFDPDADIAVGELANLASSAFTQGNVSVFEIAGEALLPLSGNTNLTLGARLSDYDPAGSANTYKLEIDSQVTESIMLRGGFQHAVRAPNVEEFFRASLLRVQPFLDPCSSRYRGPSVDRDAELALCAEQGADPGYTQGGSSAPTITDGNPDLVPEEADTFTLGFVSNFELGNVGVNFTADYYNIEVDEAIETLSAQLIMTKCFNLDGASNPTYDNNYFPCQQINRPIFAPETTAFDLDPVIQPILNLGGIKTSGIDVSASFDLPVAALAWGGGEGSLRFTAQANFLDNFEIQAFSDEGFTDFAGVVSTTQGYPELRMFNSLDINTGPITITAMWRHISEMDDISAAGGIATDIDGSDSFDYVDLVARWSIGDRYQVYGGVTNLTDEEPPQIGGIPEGTTWSGTNQGFFDGIGRSFYLGVRGSFSGF